MFLAVLIVALYEAKAQCPDEGCSSSAENSLKVHVVPHQRVMVDHTFIIGVSTSLVNLRPVARCPGVPATAPYTIVISSVMTSNSFELVPTSTRSFVVSRNQVQDYGPVNWVAGPKGLGVFELNFEVWVYWGDCLLASSMDNHAEIEVVDMFGISAPVHAVLFWAVQGLSGVGIVSGLWAGLGIILQRVQSRRVAARRRVHVNKKSKGK